MNIVTWGQYTREPFGGGRTRRSMAAVGRGIRQCVLSALCVASQVLLIPEDPAARRSNEAQRRSGLLLG